MVWGLRERIPYTLYFIQKTAPWELFFYCTSFGDVGVYLDMTNITNKKLLFLLPAFLLLTVGGAVFMNSAHAAMWPGRSAASGGPGGFMRGGMTGVFGTVTAVNGTTLTVQGMMRGGASTTYSIDGSNAAVVKNGATSTISAVLVGDRISAQGTVNGSSVIATKIFDGNLMRGGFHGSAWGSSSTASGTKPFIHGERAPPFGSSTAMMQVSSVSGTVGAVNGSILTVNGANGAIYTVDVTNAALVKKGSATSSVSAINVGDAVQVQGSVSGTAVTANVILDNVNSPAASNGNAPRGPGFIGAIMGFFARLFKL